VKVQICSLTCSGICSIYFLKIVKPNTNVNIHKPKNMLNRICAIEAAPSEIPVKPNIPATIAMIKKAADHLNITIVLFLYKSTVAKRLQVDY
jgi:hypothetical protein